MANDHNNIDMNSLLDISLPRLYLYNTIHKTLDIILIYQQGKPLILNKITKGILIPTTTTKRINRYHHLLSGFFPPNLEEGDLFKVKAVFNLFLKHNTNISSSTVKLNNTMNKINKELNSKIKDKV